jgi:Protein of unknown function (DUF2950)
MRIKIKRTIIILGLTHFQAILMAVMVIILVMPTLSLANAGTQQKFGSPEETVKAMVKALQSKDINALEMILGPDSRDLITSGDPIADQAGYARFLKLYQKKSSLEQTGHKRVLLLGDDDWPFPIPIVKKDGLWAFDSQEGHGEILARRIGRNELSAIQVCLAYVDAQREYALEDRDADGSLQYAQKFKSDKGMKNGLYWDVKNGEPLSPLGLLISAAQEKGYDTQASDDAPVPYHGYYYRILTGQGKHAPGGDYDYMVRKKMIGGFALVAFPATYASSGIMTFMVNHKGVVYEKDLGPGDKVAQRMQLFDPDELWEKVE